MNVALSEIKVIEILIWWLDNSSLTITFENATRYPAFIMQMLNAGWCGQCFGAPELEEISFLIVDLLSQLFGHRQDECVQVS